jgi:uncharacterized membrane protein
MGDKEQEDYELYLKNRELLTKIKDSSEQHFEKNLVYITSGTLALSMTFIEKIVPLKNAMGIPALIFGWVFLTISLLINLISHRTAARNSRDRTRELDDEVDDTTVQAHIDADNKKMDKINDWTVYFMILGIGALVVYCSINAFQMSKQYEDKDGHKKGGSGKEWIEKGLTSDRLVRPRPQPAATQPVTPPKETP